MEGTVHLLSLQENYLRNKAKYWTHWQTNWMKGMKLINTWTNNCMLMIKLPNKGRNLLNWKTTESANWSRYWWRITFQFQRNSKWWTTWKNILRLDQVVLMGLNFKGKLLTALHKKILKDQNRKLIHWKK